MDDAITGFKTRNPEPFIASVPGSKSFTNRALVIAAHQLGRTVIHNALICDDTIYFSKALSAFEGLDITQDGNSFIVERTSETIVAPEEPVYFGAAGTPVRLMLSFVASAKGQTLVTGNERLSERPMKDILDAFDTAGIEYECKGEPGHLPVLVTGGAAKTANWKINGSVSSQFLSSLLIHASQQLDKPEVNIEVLNYLVSRPYIEMTLEMMEKVGLKVEEPEPNHFKVTPCRSSASDIEVEIDASGMSYILTAAVLTQTTVKINGISRNSKQGDVGLVDVYKQMGCQVKDEEDAIVFTGAPISGIDIDMEKMPDVVLSLAVAATQASGPVTITNIANLRVKECDRIAAACNELKRLGVEVEEGDDWMRIHPAKTLKPVQVKTYDDHRVAMAFSLLGLVVEGISVEEPECVSKSFPGFWDEMKRFVDFHQ
jgi:3-phosphoshikimate 1-carboxyvinyltransferase